MTLLVSAFYKLTWELACMCVLNLTYVSAYLQNISNIGDFCRISLLNKTQNTLFWPTHRLWNGTWSLVPRHAGRSGMLQKLKNCENFSLFVKVSINSISTFVVFEEFLNNRRTDGICAGAMPFPRNFLIIWFSNVKRSTVFLYYI